MNGWIPVKGYEGLYEVNSNGVVRNSANHHQIAVKIKSGYCQVGLFKKGKQTWTLLHRIVAIAFLPEVEGKPEINHKDGDKQNNGVENLEWCSRDENLRHAFEMGLRDQDTSSRQIDCISPDGLSLRFPSIYKAARALKISQGNICMVCKGQRPLASGYSFKYADGR